MAIKIRKPLNLLPDLWDKIEEQRIKENRSTYHNMIDTMIRAYLNKDLVEITTKDSKQREFIEVPNRSSFGSIKYDPNKIKL